MKTQLKHTIQLDDLTLWSNLKLGDEKAFSQLFEKYYSHLVQYGNSFSTRQDKVQDCVQDVFTDVWIYRNTLNDSVLVKAYLFASVRKRISRLYLRYHEGLRVEEIAATFEVNYQSASNLLYRAILNIRKEWKQNIMLFLLLSINFI